MSRSARGWLRPLRAAGVSLAAGVALGVGVLGPFWSALADVSGSVPLLRDPPAWLAGWSPHARSVERIQQEAMGTLLGVTVAFTIVALVGLLVNLTAVLLLHAASRRREAAVRAAVGARGIRLVGMHAAELLPLYAVSLAAGVAAGLAAASLLGRAWPGGVDPLGGADRALRPALLTIALLLLAAFLAWTSPAAVGWRRDLRGLLAAGARATAGPWDGVVRGALAVIQVASSLVLLTAAALLLRAFGGAASLPPEAADPTTRELGLPAALHAEPERAAAAYADVLRRVGHALGTEAVSLATAPSWVGIGPRDRVHGLSGNWRIPGTLAHAEIHSVSPGYFAAVGAERVRGRDLAPGDTLGGESVAVVNRAYLATFRLAGDPVGKRLQLHSPGLASPWFRIVGVVDDPVLPGIGGGSVAEPAVYLSILQHPPGAARLAYPAGGADASRAVEREIRAAHPGIEVGRPVPLSRIRAEFRAPLRWFSALFSILAGVSLLTAGAGLYGLTLSGVARRTREIAIRLCVGARPGDVLRLVVVGAIRLTAAGAVLGMIGALATGRLLQLLLAGVRPADPRLYFLLAGLLLGVAVVASARGARRAASLDPHAALREE